MKMLNKLFILAGLVFGVISCDYLDVVPDDAPTLDDAFKNRAAAEKSLFTCFSYLPDPTNPYYYPAYFTSHDEYEIGLSSWVRPTPAYVIGNGDQNTNNPAMNYFSGLNGGKSMFQAIRQCNTFLDNINVPRDMEETERLRWIAEAKFLKAYYHFFLLELYGPIPLIKESLPLASSPEEVRVYREPVDECIDYIVGLIDEAVPDLPLIPPFPTEDNGRITQPIALAVKAKALTWAASPLFNGNSDYAGWTDKRGKQLISSVYSKEKWERAATAIKNAIDTCHLAGLGLYEYNPALSAQTFAMNDSLVLTMTHRKAITERWNKGVIWSSMEVFANGKGGVSYAAYGNFQRALMPRMYATDVNAETSFLYASTSMAELYYSKNGIPIEEDEAWGYGNRYKTQVSTPAVGNTYYIQPGQVSAYLNFNREPRFYASLGFDRGFFELSTETTNGGKSFNTALQLRFGEAGSGTNPIGYAVKKLVAFETSASRGSTYAYAGYDYRFPLIRLADLYLLYSEALNEIKASPDAEVYEWIDQVRRVAGLKGVIESWSFYSNNPDRPADKDEMRKIIQQERMIELAFEGQRFWDVRRWKLAAQLWTKPTYGWSFTGRTADDYYVRTEVFPGRKFTFKDYLWPIRQSDLRINNNLEQTYGW
jgi:hypothetical protein